MADLKMEWTVSSQSQFEALRKRAIDSDKYDEFRTAHNEIVGVLCTVGLALEKGERLYHTRRPGGEVRHWVYRTISVCYVVFRAEQVGWILNYQSVPESWPK